MTIGTEARHSDTAVEVSGLTVSFVMGDRPVEVLSDVSFSLRRNRITGLVGESGSGKSVTALAIMDLLPQEAEVAVDRVRIGDDVFESIDRSTVGARRGNELSMIFQEPIRSLNPAFRAGDQIAAVVRRHKRVSGREARHRATELLELVGIPDPARTAAAFPHQLSGGMSQRVMIALALAGEPNVLFADEPTTALDATTQAQVLALLKELADRLGMTTLIATHDLGVVAELCDDVIVMYAGEIVEMATVEEVFARPRHPYTRALLSCSRLDDGALRGIPGSVPQPGKWPRGCRFAPRCEIAVEGACTAEPLPLRRIGTRSTRCRRAEEMDL
ncbi:ABC transporter ATP-binding protein [Microbacterium soli]|uniref:ABC transporter ATP-binding protein n=1 Tax=Microbacterium soli TaxID=446075 RepID=A0ABP7MXE5_9MICO